MFVVNNHWPQGRKNPRRPQNLRRSYFHYSCEGLSPTNPKFKFPRTSQATLPVFCRIFAGL